MPDSANCAKLFTSTVFKINHREHLRTQRFITLNLFANSIPKVEFITKGTDNMAIKTYFNPGCALSIYKPEMENEIISFLNQNYEETTMHKICCRHEPQLENDSLIINVCAGCDRRFGSL